jgi:hypothetical protein
MRALMLLTTSFLCLLAVACNSRSDFYEGDDPDLLCRSNPIECDGEIGGDCVVTDDCSDGVCCRDGNCGGKRASGLGMCTYVCAADFDCPPSMACEHGHCFFRCSGDAECGPGQSCEHGNTICEYED